ncbi:sulfotransferase 2B1-like isoform X2 [Notamacropus eugenii]|uniref:sulfotransferase 2B1-like isoform X2 n=1 Tax=Notamacropus eugenii TaxID=9315 RepID=UPI003B66BC78
MDRIKVTEVFEGISMPGHLHTQESLNAATNFQFQDTDVLLVTFPKSGTTWMQQILSLIFNKEDLQSIQNTPTWTRVPWVEHISFSDYLPQMEASKPRLLTTHFPARLLIHNLKNTKARVVYLARNPKDVLVSYYHFHKLAKFLPDFSSFEDFFDQFLEGKVNFGSWFNHIKDWLGVQQELNFFLITYEDLSQDPRQAIQNLSTFLGQQLEPKELENILHYCSFSFMSQNDLLNYSLIPPVIFDHSVGKFLRKDVSIFVNLEEDFHPGRSHQSSNSHLRSTFCS